MEKAEELLAYWFGRVEDTILPSENRTRVWFSDDPNIDHEIKEKFGKEFQDVIDSKLDSWKETPRGTLALIIMFDQFTRHLFRDSASSYSYDNQALDLCLLGIEQKFDHTLSLIERAFFYFPLMHSEEIEMQATAVRAYKILVDLSFSEARGIYESFLDYALRHFEIIKRFGRFPERNEILGRVPTVEEIAYMKDER